MYAGMDGCVFAHSFAVCYLKILFQVAFLLPHPSVSLRCRHSACDLQARTIHGCLKAATTQPYAVRRLHHSQDQTVCIFLSFLYTRVCVWSFSDVLLGVWFMCVYVCVRAHAQQLGICSYAWHFGFEIRQEIVMQKSVFCLFVFSFLHLGCSWRFLLRNIRKGV